MTTARDIVYDAAAAAGLFGQGDTISDDDAQLILRRFGRLLESYSTDTLMGYDFYTDTLSLTAGGPSYATSLLANGRPVSIDSIYVRLSNADHKVDLVGNTTYEFMPVKASSGLPVICWYNPSMPDGTLNFYPAPSTTMTAYVNCRRNLKPTSMTLTSTVSFPPGYERGLVDLLAVDICPSFGQQVQPALAQSAMEAKRLIKRANYVQGEMSVLLTPRFFPNIIDGP